MTALPWHQAELARMLARRDALPHALLVRGRRGIGKLAFARALAESLLCEQPAASGHACGRCRSCGWMTADAHPDFRMIEPAGATGEEGEETPAATKRGGRQIAIEQVRELGDFIGMSSHRGGHRIALLHPAEALNASAANALLKSLEEPPPGMCFILVSHRAHFLLPTMVSRCRQVVLPDPDPADSASWLKAQGVAEPALALAQSGNSPLLALEFGEEGYWKRRQLLLGRIADAGFDPLQTAEQIRDFAVTDVLGWLQKWTYDLILSGHTGNVRYNPDFIEEITRLSRRFNALQVARFHRHAIRLQRVVHHPLNTRLLFEQLLIDYAALVQPRSSRKAPDLAG